MILLLMFLMSVKLSSGVSLKEVVDLSIKNSDLLNSYYHKVKEADYELDSIKLMRYGGMNIKSIYTKGDEPVYAFASKMRQGDFSMADMMNINNPDSISNLELQLEVGIPLFTGFKIYNYEKLAKKNIEVNRKMYEEAKNGISFQSIYKYLMVSFYKKLKTLADERIKSSEVELESARKLNEKGMIFGSDYYAALSIYNILKKYKTSFEKDMEKELKSLSVLTQKEFKEDDIDFDMSMIYWNIKEEEYYINTAVSNRYLLKIYDDYEDMNNIQVDIAKKSILGDITAFFSFSGNTKSLDNMKTSYIYGLKMDFPVGKPSYYSEVKKFKEKLNQTKELKKNEKRNIIDEIKQTYSDLISSLDSIKILSEAVLSSEKSVELFRPLYRQGKQSIMEVLRAEANLFEAKSKYYEAVLKYHIYYIKLNYLAQQLDENIIKEISEKFQKNN